MKVYKLSLRVFTSIHKNFYYLESVRIQRKRAAFNKIFDETWLFMDQKVIKNNN